MGYRLGKRSRRNLVGIHPLIVKVVKRAIEITTRDFMVFEGMRSKKRQKMLRITGKSKTWDTYHFYGLAVDLVALDNKGRLSWDLKLYRAINKAMKRAMKELSLDILDNGQDIWGWDAAHWQLKDINGVNAKKVYRKKKHIGFVI